MDVVESRTRTDIERRVQQNKARARAIHEPGHPVSDAASEKIRLERALLLLTEDERLVLIWKKAGFSDREIAKHLSRPASAVREVHRSGVSKIQLSHEVTIGTTTSDDHLSLNCPLCGIRLAFRGRVNDCRMFTCAVHGDYCIEPTGHFRRAAE
jgi:hypothetical protein